MPLVKNDTSAKEEYVNKLHGLQDDALMQEAKSMIWFSAFASNNPRSAYHWKCDAVYDECQRRARPAIYSTAYAYHVPGSGGDDEP